MRMGSGGSRDVPLLGSHATSRTGYTGPRWGNSVAGPGEVSLQRMRRGQWTHVAVAWDAAAVRMYVDGVLYARTTQGPLRWRGAPTGWCRACPEPVHLPCASCLAALLAEFGSDPPGELLQPPCECGGSFARHRLD